MNVEGLISDLAFLLLLGAGVTILFKWIRQPVVLGYIVAGFLASPHFEYLPSITTEDNIEFWAQIGIVVLLFSLGLEFSFQKLMNVGGSAAITAAIIVAGMMTAGFAIGHLLGFSHINSLFLGGMLSMSSTTIIIKALTDLGLRQKKFAGIVFAVLVVEDLFAVVMMVVLSSIAINDSVEGGQLLGSVAKLVFFLVIWFLVGMYVIPSLLNLWRRWLNAESLLVVSMGLCLGMAVFSVYCGFSLALGAFVMGSILASTSYAERIEHVTAPVKDLFGAVFFISVGMMVQPAVIVQYWWPILIISVVVIVGMAVFGTLGMLVTGQTLRVAIESGFCLTQIGEFAFIIATLGMSLGVLDPQIYPIVVAVSVLTTFTTPYFIRMAPGACAAVEKALPQSWRHALDRFASQSHASQGGAGGWGDVVKRYLGRTALYSCLLIAIDMVCWRYGYPWLSGLVGPGTRAAVVTCAAALVAMSPFLLALMSPVYGRRRTAGGRSGDPTLGSVVPLVVMWALRVLVALAFVVVTLWQAFRPGVGLSIGIGLVLLLTLMLSKRTRRRLAGIEERFMRNLNERELRRSGRGNNVVSDLHLAYMQVGYACPFVGERLRNSGLRSRYGVNLLNIQRGQDIITIPDGDTRLFPGDVLGVIGTDGQLQRLLPVVEAAPAAAPSACANREYRLTTMALEEGSPLCGQTMVTAAMRNAYGVLAVALQREGLYVPLRGDTTFAAGDVLWIAGTKEALGQLARSNRRP